MKPSSLNAGILFSSVVLVSGCNFAGPTSIRQGRTNYNEAIHDTSREQMLLNFVRVANHDSTLFIDVTEVDAAMQFSGTLSANAGLPQAKSASGRSSTAVTSGGTSSGQTVTTTNVPLFTGHDFSLTGGSTYQESPTVRYQPLLGQALVAQIATPISPESIGTMVDSDWPIRSLLTLVADRLTPNYADYYNAIDLIGYLDDYGALVIVPTHASSSKPPEPPAQTGITQFLNLGAGAAIAPKPDSSTSPKADCLTLFYHPGGANSDADPEVVSAQLDRKWRALCLLYNGPQAKSDPLPPRIDIRFAVSSAKEDASCGTTMPVLRTRSGLGILRAASHEDWGISVLVSKSDYERLQPMIYLVDHPAIMSNLQIFPNPTTSRSSGLGEPAWSEVLDRFLNLLEKAKPGSGACLSEEQRSSLKKLTSLGKQLKESDFDLHYYKPIPMAEDQISDDEVNKQSAEAYKLNERICGLSKDEQQALAMFQIGYLQHADQYTGPEDSYASNFYVFDAKHLDSDELRRARPVAPQIHTQLESIAFSEEILQTTSPKNPAPRVQALDNITFEFDARDKAHSSFKKYLASQPQKVKDVLYPAVNSPAARDGINRHFIVIVRDSGGATDSFVDINYRGKTYYVTNDDDVSRKNLALIQHFLTVQAVPQASANLTPTINVGAP